MIRNKHNCAHDLGASLRRTQGWRNELTRKYPNDHRNKKAAEKLEEFANEATNLSDEQYSKLASHYNWCSPVWSDAVSLASRRVEFRGVRTFTAFLDDLVNILEQQSVAA